MYAVYNEVFEQKPVLSQVYDHILDNGSKVIELVNAYKPGEIVFIACGSSYWLSMAACLTMQRETGIRCSAVKSGDIVMDETCYAKAYRKPLLICPSRSGKTAETLIAIKKMKAWYGAKVLAITEYEDSPIQEIAEVSLLIPWANEVSLMQTRSFSCLYLSCILLSGILGENRQLLDDMRWYIDHYDLLAKDAAERTEKITNTEFAEYDHLVSLGTGCQYGVSVEGGYIQFEIAKARADYFATLEYRHGPFLTNTNSTLFALLSTGVQIEREEKVLEEVRKPGARVLTISADTDFANTDWNFKLGREIAPEAVALYAAMVTQGLAFYKALRNGVNPDHPVEGDPPPFIASV